MVTYRSRSLPISILSSIHFGKKGSVYFVNFIQPLDGNLWSKDVASFD
jgi:hypothetical protein